MSDRDALTPRVILFRHGETEWAKSGRFTGTTEAELTEAGAAQVSATAGMIVGAERLLDPHRLAHVFVSPRVRATATFQLLLGQSDVTEKTTYTEEIAEWNYGKYEGLKDQEIRDLRKKEGLDKEKNWNIWADGCEGGESSKEVAERLDKLIFRIKEIQRPRMLEEKPADILLVAHGLILRCFVKRWLGLSVDNPLPIMLDPGAFTILSYTF